MHRFVWFYPALVAQQAHSKQLCQELIPVLLRWPGHTLHGKIDAHPEHVGDETAMTIGQWAAGVMKRWTTLPKLVCPATLA